MDERADQQVSWECTACACKGGMLRQSGGCGSFLPAAPARSSTQPSHGFSPNVAGFISYVSILEEGLKPDVLYTYDLQLPRDFVPKPQDGEVRGRCGCSCGVVMMVRKCWWLGLRMMGVWGFSLRDACLLGASSLCRDMGFWGTACQQSRIPLTHPHPPSSLVPSSFLSTLAFMVQVEEFMLWDLARVAEVMAHTDDYKPNCGVVVMDFLVSHDSGIIFSNQHAVAAQ